MNHLLIEHTGRTVLWSSWSKEESESWLMTLPDRGKEHLQSGLSLASAKSVNSVSILDLLDVRIFCFMVTSVKDRATELVTQARISRSHHNSTFAFEVMMMRLSDDPPLRSGHVHS